MTAEHDGGISAEGLGGRWQWYTPSTLVEAGWQWWTVEVVTIYTQQDIYNVGSGGTLEQTTYRRIYDVDFSLWRHKGGGLSAGEGDCWTSRGEGIVYAELVVWVWDSSWWQSLMATCSPDFTSLFCKYYFCPNSHSKTSRSLAARITLRSRLSTSQGQR